MPEHSSTHLSLHFHPSSSINIPSTDNGRLWNSGLKLIVKCLGWSELHWGGRVESPDIVDLFISFQSADYLEQFLSTHVEAFLDYVDCLLFPGAETPQLYTMDLFLGAFEQLLLSTVYFVTFSKGEKNKDEEKKVGLGIETQVCRQYFQRIAAEIPGGEEGAEANVGLNAVWLRPYLAMSKAVAGLDRDIIAKPEAVGSAFPALTLLVIASWKDMKTEQAVLAKANEYFLKNILERGSTYEKHHVWLESVSKMNVAWLDKDEKWSTYVKRLMAVEGLEKAKEKEGNPSGVEPM